MIGKLLDEPDELLEPTLLELDELLLEGTLLVVRFVFVFEVVKPMARPMPTPTVNEATIEIIIGSFFILNSPYKTNMRIRSIK